MLFIYYFSLIKAIFFVDRLASCCLCTLVCDFRTHHVIGWSLRRSDDGTMAMGYHHSLLSRPSQPAMPPRPILLTTLLIIMLSATARAFGTRALPFCRTTAPRSFARGMSTSEPDTSVVDTCQQKIKAALDADDVKVTGKLKGTASIGYRDASWFGAIVSHVCRPFSLRRVRRSQWVAHLNRGSLIQV
jgi:hypothetical protein